MLALNYGFAQERAAETAQSPNKKLCEEILGEGIEITEIVSIIGVAVVLFLSLTGTVEMSALYALIPGGAGLLGGLADVGELVYEVKDTKPKKVASEVITV